MAGATDLPWIAPAEQLAAIGRAVITTDPPGVVLSWNRAAQDLHGWTAAEAIGRDIAELTVPEVGQEVAGTHPTRKSRPATRP
jgi:PAS domain S-box-containing protein